MGYISCARERDSKRLVMNWYALWIFVCFLLMVNAGNEKEMVSFTPNKEIQTFHVPISKYPILSWMDVKEGIYPNSKPIENQIQIGTTLSILIHFYDKSKLYDMLVENCIASDEEDLDKSENIFMLYDANSKEYHTSGRISEWNVVKNVEKFTTVFHANFSAFKFPEDDKIFLTCNIELCYNSCKTKSEKGNEI